MKPASRPISFTRPMPLMRPLGFDVATGQRLLGDFQRRGEAERAKHIRDVVVDRLGNADDGDLQPATGDLFADLVSAALRAVAADAEQHVDPLAVEEIDHHGRILRPARTAEGRAAELVDFRDVGVA